MSAPDGWTRVCRADAVRRESGVAALVGSEQVAVFRTHDDHYYALGNVDPVSGAAVLSRGIVGSRADAPFVASPMHKQAYDLRKGVCLDDVTLQVPVFAVRVSDDGSVLVGPRVHASGAA